MSEKIWSIDAVVNIWTEEAMAHRPETFRNFFVNKMNVEGETYNGISLDETLRRMDASYTERSFLIATVSGRKGLPGTARIPYEMVAEAVKKHPDRFSALAGIDPYEGMDGVRRLERAVQDDGFIGAHYYPHWFELAPDHAKVYPFYAKCVELDIPIQMQVGQSMIYAPELPLRSVARPITLDAVACDFPELKLIGIHIGIPWTEEMIAMAWKHKNIYIGCDAHRPLYWPEAFKHYINTFGRNKVIFGTDFPILDFEKTRSDIESLGLRPEVLPLLLRENCERVYKLKR